MRMKILSSQKALTLFLFMAVILFLAGTSDARQENARMDLKTTAVKEVTLKQQGKTMTKRIPLDKANPGDVVVYTITYSNPGNGPILDAVIVNPVPEGVSYIADTAEGKGADITCSIDKGRTWQKPPVMIDFKKPDGSLEKKPASPDMYTHIKWAIKKPVAPGQSGEVSFKVTVK